MPSTAVILAPSWQLAQDFTAKGFQLAVTIEAEYGAQVWEGSRYTAAHHQASGPYQGKHEGGTRPSPCNDPDIPVVAEGEMIGISHVDLDTVGGVLRALGREEVFSLPGSTAFWGRAEFVDTHGPHRLPAEHPQRPRLEAWWAWSTHPDNRPKIDRTQISDMGWFIDKAEDVLKGILDTSHEDHEALMKAGREWAAEQAKLNAETLRATIALPNGYSLIVRDGPSFTNHLYNTPDGHTADVVVALRRDFNSITVTLEDNGKASGLSARRLVQAIWPDVSAIVGHALEGEAKKRTFSSPQAAVAAVEAAGGYPLDRFDADVQFLSGGQRGAAGGPRGMACNPRDLWHAAQVLVEVVGSLPDHPRNDKL